MRAAWADWLKRAGLGRRDAAPKRKAPAEGWGRGFRKGQRSQRGTRAPAWSILNGVSLEGS